MSEGLEYIGSDKWLEAKKQSLRRDNANCQDCGMGDGECTREFGKHLESHHIKRVDEFDDPEDAHYADNLVTLCPACHRNRHASVVTHDYDVEGQVRKDIVETISERQPVRPQAVIDTLEYNNCREEISKLVASGVIAVDKHNLLST